MTPFIGGAFRGGPASAASARLDAPDAPVSTHLFPLVGTLLLRATMNGCFVLWLIATTPGWSEVFRGGAVLALADGGLGALMAALLMRHEPLRAAPVLVAMILVDAALRLSVGVAIRYFPGIADLPITVVLFFGVLGAWAAMAGVLAMAAWVVSHEPKRNAMSVRRAHALFDPLASAGVVALLMALYALIVGPPATTEALRTAAGTASAGLAVVFGVAAVGVAGLSRRRQPE